MTKYGKLRLYFNAQINWEVRVPFQTFLGQKINQFGVKKRVKTDEIQPQTRDFQPRQMAMISREKHPTLNVVTSNHL